MKTIKKPARDFKFFEVVCRGCDAVLLPQRASEFTQVYDQRDGDFASFYCPHCQTRVTISRDRFPAYIWQKMSAAPGSGDPF